MPAIVRATLTVNQRPRISLDRVSRAYTNADLAVYAANPLTAAELTQLQNIGATAISAAQWGYLGATTAFGASIMAAASEAAFKAAVNLEAGTDFNAYSANLATWSGVAPSANGQSLVAAANYAAMRALLDLEAGTDFYSISAADAAIAAAVAAHLAGDPHTQYLLESAVSANGLTLIGETFAQMRGSLDLEAGTDFEAYASALSTGVVEIYIPASAMTSRTTNGAAAGTVESTTNKVMQITKNFDQTTQEFVQFTWFPPKSWNLSTVTFIPVCIPAGSSGGWVFGMAGVAISNDDVIDAAFGTAQTSADSFIAATDVHVGPECSAITIAGTPAAADFVVFQINRTVADGGDTHNGDVKLLGIKLRYTINAKNDT